MKYLKIQSKGEIQIEALTLVGASTKKDDESKIGFFGSGNKYALSAMLRQGISFHIFSGNKKIDISTKNISFRDRDFKQVLINGKETSLTTEMGGNDWNSSFSFIREIYSNALDEDQDAMLTVVDNPIGVAEHTCFFIEYTKDVEVFHKNIFAFFCSKNPAVLHSNEIGSIYPNREKTVRLFRKGILCHTDEKQKSLFQYNSDFPINESRVLSDTWDAKYKIGGLWKICKDEQLIKELLYGISGGNTGYYEHSLVWGTYHLFSKEWETVITELKFVAVEHVDLFDPQDLKGRIAVQFDILKELKNQFIDKIDILGLTAKSSSVFTPVKVASKALQNKVIDALGILLSTDYQERWGSPEIVYVKFLDENTLALALDGKIYLSVKLDSYSLPEIAKILIEENEHNLSGFGDKTRQFQNHLFNLYYEQLTK